MSDHGRQVGAKMGLCWPTWRPRWATWEHFGKHLGSSKPTFLKNVELFFFPIEEKKTQLEEVIDMRMKMLLGKDIYALFE